MSFAAHDPVRITYDGRTVEGEVVLCSANGRSVVVRFEAILGGYAGTMAVLDGRDLLHGQPVVIEPVER